MTKAYTRPLLCSERIELVEELISQLRAAGFRASQKLACFVDMPEYEIHVGHRGFSLDDLPEDIAAVAERARQIVHKRWEDAYQRSLRAEAYRSERALDDMRRA